MAPSALHHPAANETLLLLAGHHEEIGTACVSLRMSAFTDDPLEVIVRFRNLEHAVLEHMKIEEDSLLPAYARYAPADAAVIRVAHEDLRRQLYRLGIEAELRYLRIEAIDHLIATLREHAAHETRGMYPWAQSVLTPDAKRELFKRISRSLRALALSKHAAEPSHR
jgi:hypothetical protein